MKKYLIVWVLISSFLLWICSIDWKDEKDKKIGELERQVQELKNKDQLTNLDLQDKCAKKAKEFFTEQYTDEKDYSYENHFNKKLNKCFVVIYSTKVSWEIIWTHKSIFDAYEWKTYADYSWHTVKDKKYWEVKPIVCQIWDWYCTTTEEFDEGIKKYTEN